MAPISLLNASLKKRCRDSFESPPEDSPEALPFAKRKEHTSKAGTYRWHRPPNFWNRLSKVHLTRGALREFDRRTSRAHQPVLTPCSGINTSPGPGAKTVKRFSRQGGPDLAHVRGYANRKNQNNAMNESKSSRERSFTSGGSDSARKSKSSYDANFEQNLIDGGIYPHNRGSKPENAQDIREYMARPRASLSPSRFDSKDFEDFTSFCDKTGDEANARSDIISIIAGDGRKQHKYASDRLFNHLEPLAENLPAPKPDLYDGALPEQIDQSVRRDLGKHIVPSNNNTLPAAPNLFMEGKSEGGRADVAKRQACHDGAVGARAMHSLQNYKSAEPKYDGEAYSYSATFHPGTATLQLYAHHLTAPKAPGRPAEYHMTLLNGFHMTGNVNTFREGAGGFRHLRDRAKTNRDVFIDHANQIARLVPADTPSTTLTDSCTSLSVLQEDDSGTSIDDLVAKQTTTKRKRHATP